MGDNLKHIALCNLLSSCLNPSQLRTTLTGKICSQREPHVREFFQKRAAHFHMISKSFKKKIYIYISHRCLISLYWKKLVWLPSIKFYISFNKVHRSSREQQQLDRVDHCHLFTGDSPCSNLKQKVFIFIQKQCDVDKYDLSNVKGIH